MKGEGHVQGRRERPGHIQISRGRKDRLLIVRRGTNREKEGRKRKNIFVN